MSDNSKLFETSEISECYLKYRPTYGPDVFNTMISFCRETVTKSPFSLAIDVGCGSGQSTLPLSRHFQKVIGVDVSEAQIAKAPTHISNLSFRVGPAEDLSFSENGSADLVTVAQAMHWMDKQRLYPEVERVLKRVGPLLSTVMALPALDEPKAQDILNHVSCTNDVLGPYWSDGRNRVEEHYQSYSLPFPGWRSEMRQRMTLKLLSVRCFVMVSPRNDSLKIERSWSVGDFIGYLCSWSAYQKYLLANTLNNTMADVRRSLQEIYQDGQGPRNEREVKITWPVFMLLGHKPQA